MKSKLQENMREEMTKMKNELASETKINLLEYEIKHLETYHMGSIETKNANINHHEKPLHGPQTTPAASSKNTKQPKKKKRTVLERVKSGVKNTVKIVKGGVNLDADAVFDAGE